MNRREFITGAAAAGVVLASGKVYAGEDKSEPMRLNSKDNPTELEQKHVPLIEAPDKAKAGQWIDVKVKVGFMKDHPSTPEHWITYVKLLADDKEIAKAEYPVGGIVSSSAVFKIKLDKTVKLEVVEHCNLHGTWISESVKVDVS
ncbi:MAG: class II SORL domain-containing protein [Candidatus Magnetominusculus sp. LBB02]|nr:class II SORL domain-containing protein [Candidatus Magnetominusculus sp. LBB02]